MLSDLLLIQYNMIRLVIAMFLWFVKGLANEKMTAGQTLASYSVEH